MRPSNGLLVGRRGLVLGAAGAASVSVARRARAGAATGTPVRLLVTGDSISQGSVGDFTWRYRLWQKLEADSPGAVTFVGTRGGLYDDVNDTVGSLRYAVPFPGHRHSARWGTALFHELHEVEEEVRASRATTMVTLLGGNDLAFDVATPAELADELRNYVTRARSADPTLQVVLCEVPSRWDPARRQYVLVQETQDLADRLTTLAADLTTAESPVVVAHVLHGWDPRVHTYDGTHPDPTGETLIAQRVSEALAGLGIGTAGPDVFRRVAWTVRGPAPTVAVRPGHARLSWDRTSTGASGMLLEFRRTDARTWTRLPYAVGAADGDAWTIGRLTGGARYRFRLVPSKGSMVGRPGPAVERRVPRYPSGAGGADGADGAGGADGRRSAGGWSGTSVSPR